MTKCLFGEDGYVAEIQVHLLITLQGSRSEVFGAKLEQAREGSRKVLEEPLFVQRIRLHHRSEGRVLYERNVRWKHHDVALVLRRVVLACGCMVWGAWFRV